MIYAVLRAFPAIHFPWKLLEFSEYLDVVVGSFPLFLKCAHVASNWMSDASAGESDCQRSGDRSIEREAPAPLHDFQYLDYFTYMCAVHSPDQKGMKAPAISFITDFWINWSRRRRIGYVQVIEIQFSLDTRQIQEFF